MAKVEYQIDLLDAEAEANSGTYVSIPLAKRQCVLIDTSKFVSPAFYFEAVIRAAASGNTSYARLYRQGTSDDCTASGLGLSESEVSEAGTTYARKRSGALTLLSGYRHRVEIRNTSASTIPIIRAARIIVVDDITAGWSAGEEAVEIGNANETTTSGTAVELSNPPIYLYESAKRDGSVTIYFEAVFYSSSSGKSVEISLWNKTDNTQVIELATTAANPTRVRSSAISLMDGKEYWVKKRSSSGKTCTLTGAKLIIQQSGTITKTQLHKKTAIYKSGTDTVYVRVENQVYLEKSNLPASLTFYYQPVLKVTSPNTAYSELYDMDTPASVSGSEQSTTSTTYIRLRSASISLTDLKQYDARVKTSAGTYYTSAAWIVIDAVAQIIKEVTDSLGLADNVLRDKTFAVTDSVGLADASPLRDKAFAILDSIGLTDVSLKHWTPQITDAVGLADTISLAKLKVILDSLGLSDAVLRHKILAETDSIGLSDTILRNKTFAVTDSIGLADTPLKNWTPRVTDSISLSDFTLTLKTLIISDTISLSDAILALKTLFISDQISLSELIQVISEIIKYVTDSIELADQIGTPSRQLISADSVSLSDAILRNKLFAIVESILSSDQILTDKTLIIADTIGLTDLIYALKTLIVTDNVNILDQALINKILSILDSLGLTEAIYKHWSPQVVDAVTLTDLILRDKVLAVIDVISLAEAIQTNKTLTISDSIFLTEIIEVITAVVIKYVADSISLTDLIKINKTLQVSDTITILKELIKAANLIEAPQLIVTKDGKLILRISRPTKSKPDYISLGG